MNKSELPIEQIQASKQYFIPFIVGLIFALICAVTGVTTSRADELKVFMYGKSKEIKDNIEQIKKESRDTLSYDLIAAEETEITLRVLNESRESFFSEGIKMNALHRKAFIVFTVMLIFSYICFLFGLVQIGYF